MFRPTVVVAPTDFSDAAAGAVETAAGIASRTGAKLVLVHVVPMLPTLPASVSIFKEGEYERSLQEDAGRRLAALAAKYTQAGIAVETEIGLANEVAGEINLISKKHGADLIVIATHGMTGWNAYAFGSVAEKVLRTSPVSVFVIKGPPGAA